MIKNLLILMLAFCISLTANAKEDCSIEAIGLAQDADKAQKLYYTGTCHYRNGEYDKSAVSWEALATMEQVKPDYIGLQSDVLNNLGYLLFFGYGVPENKTQAIDYWKKAITLGQYESEYHLCHAHADMTQPTFNKVMGKKYCDKAYLIYNGIDQQSESKDEILKNIKHFRSLLLQN